MKSDDKVARWHWHATLQSERSSIVSTRQYEFRLIYRYVPAEQFPFIEGHQFTLEWRDLFFPEGLGDGSRERYITEDFRRDIVVVRAQGVAGVPIWTERIADGLSVHVALAAPEQRFGDNMDCDNVFRVSYQYGGQRRYVARYNPNKSAFSMVAATEWEV